MRVATRLGPALLVFAFSVAPLGATGTHVSSPQSDRPAAVRRATPQIETLKLQPLETIEHRQAR